MSTSDRFPVSRDALSAVCEEFDVVELSAFGSVLRDDFAPDSDIDLLVVFDPARPVGLFHVLRLQRRLSELAGRPVDLVPKQGLKPHLREQVLASAQLLYAA